MRRRDEPRAWPKLGESAIVASARSDRRRRARVRDLERAVTELAQRERTPGVTVTDVQLVAQLCAGASYPLWRDGVERSWRRQATRSTGRQWSTAGWPRVLSDEHVAVLLTPLPAGRVGLAARNARPVADPVFSHGVPLAGAPATDPVLEVLLTWIKNPGSGHTARLAPPVIEVMVRGQLDERWAESFGIDWPLPLADGL